MHQSVFELALGDQAESLPDSVKSHFFLSPDEPYQIVMDGTMEYIWHRPRWIKPLLWLLAKTDTLFPETGADVPLYLENNAYRDRRGMICMEWRRRFTFPGRVRHFNALMKYDPTRRIIVDYFGKNGWLEADLQVQPFREEGKRGLQISSDRYRIRIGSLRVGLPRWLAVHALIREWTEPGLAVDEIRVEVRLTHPWLGPFFGYRGRFTVTRRAL
ncbi:MAG: DUF4166 domain-containing protein [Brevibacillus sp.]|nr:DUF4166 domain-containing protein [Brevibacillus sp.]